MTYIFSPNTLHAAVKDAVASGGGLHDKIDVVRRQLESRYPGHIRMQDDWVFNIAGGAMGQMTVLHASLREYVIVFGTPIGTEGFSGRFGSDDYFMILEGEQWAFDEGGERLTFKPGDCHRLPRGHARGYRMPDRCYALEYARGFIPAMLPFGMIDQFTSTLDMRTVAKTLRIYTHAAVSAARTRMIGAAGGRRTRSGAPIKVTRSPDKVDTCSAARLRS